MSNKQFLWSSFAFIVVDIFFRYFNNDMIFNWQRIIIESSPQSCVKVQPHQKHNVLRCEPNCHAFLSEERGQEQ
ncbi:hypothetical protein [Enterococcus faecium]|uniref:hypothetical protein n=1 Tax=Enterococcus faecium TaxID=1352 RepID=UPI003D7FE51B